jgi:hypothetical protein
MKGTLLTQLMEEYESILENTNKAKAVLSQKNSVMTKLSIAYYEAEDRHQKGGCH